MRSLTVSPSKQPFNWSFPPKDWVLSEDEVHVWVANLNQPDAEFKRLAATLSSDEQARASRFQFKPHRMNFVTARGLLRSILGGYAKTSPNELQFSYGQNGKPRLAFSHEQPLNFNLSHSGDLALYAISANHELGIDLEKISDFSDIDDVAARCFLPEEQSALQFLQPQQKAENFFRYWTRKEAQLKCSGEGLSSEPESERRFAGTVVELEPAEGYIAALAVCGNPFQLKTWQWQGRAISETVART